MSKKGSLTTKSPMDWEKTVEIIKSLPKGAKRLFLSIQLYTGRRMSDVIKLRSDHITKEHILFREKKTGKFVKVPINPALREELQGIKEGYLFPSSSNRGYWSKQYTMRIVKETFGEEAGTHSVRKTTAKRLYQSTTLYHVQEFLNHSSPKVTAKYIGESKANEILLQL